MAERSARSRRAPQTAPAATADGRRPAGDRPERLNAVAFALREGWRASPRAFLFSFLELAMRAAQGLLPLIYAVIITGIVGGDRAAALLGAVALGTVIGTNLLVGLWGIRYRVGLAQALADRFEGRTARLLASLPTLAHHEDPDGLDDIQALRDRGGAVGMAFNSTINALTWIISPVTALLVAGGADWRLLLVAAAGLPQIAITGRLSRIARAGEDAGAEHSRRTEQLLGLTASRSGASEARVFGARGFLRERIARSTERWMRPQVEAARTSAGLTLAATATYFAVAAAVIAWLGYDALQGAVSIAVMTIALTSLQELHHAGANIRMGLENLDLTARAVGRFRRLERRVAEQAAAHAGTESPPERLRTGIELRDVTFTRPGGDEAVIDALSLSLPAGATVALVGENGAGKTTLVDLLLGLHDLDAGSIEIDGTALSDLDLAAWRERCAGAFQDHARFEFAAQHAVGVGDLDAVDDSGRVLAALEDASARDVLTALPDGLGTQLGASWPDGVGLSGGQWQRLAIARGMMRRAPLLRVLDEPTSALDPATESALFDRYADAARTTSGAGGVTLLVTHRFSTVAAADLVVVLERGRVIEQGSHDELMRAGGRYHELYELQARGYA